MTNKQRYQRTFSTLHASEGCLMEVKEMKHNRPVRKPLKSMLKVKDTANKGSA